MSRSSEKGRECGLFLAPLLGRGAAARSTDPMDQQPRPSVGFFHRLATEYVGPLPQSLSSAASEIARARRRRSGPGRFVGSSPSFRCALSGRYVDCTDRPTRSPCCAHLIWPSGTRMTPRRTRRRRCFRRACSGGAPLNQSRGNCKLLTARTTSPTYANVGVD
jgi:hypothetical protein